MSDNANDEDVRFSWLVRAADALGRYVAHGGELRIADAEDGERISCLIILPGEPAGAVSAAVGNGQWREMRGQPPPDANKHAAVDAEQQKNIAYAERNRLVAALAKCFPAHLCRHEEPGYEDDWRNIVCIHLPTGQATWHIHDSEVPLFGHLPIEGSHWDGHTTEEKYARLAAVEPWRPLPDDWLGLPDRFESAEFYHWEWNDGVGGYVARHSQAREMWRPLADERDA